MWCTNPNKVKEAFFKHFEARFKKPVYHRLKINFLFSKRLSDVQASDLERRVSRDEIRLAVWNCRENKSPCPDGYSFEFFRKYWNLVGSDLCDVVKNFFETGSFLNGCNSSFVALIPKITDAKFVNDFRSISLIGSVYKVVTKKLRFALAFWFCDLVMRFCSAFWYCVLLIEDISCVLPGEDSALFKTWLHFVSRLGCVLSQRLLAFFLKTSCVLSQDLVAFCLKTSCVLSQDLLRFVLRLGCILSQDLLRFVSRLTVFCLQASYVLSTFKDLFSAFSQKESLAKIFSITLTHFNQTKSYIYNISPNPANNHHFLHTITNHCSINLIISQSIVTANLSEDIQCAGSDTRPPMLDRTDFALWKQRIRLYCQGKENGVS
nr:cysteine-rich receptor-like protein kinase [Tanacetum cinerariifolium]